MATPTQTLQAISDHNAGIVLATTGTNGNGGAWVDGAGKKQEDIMNDHIEEMLEYWESPLEGAAGDDAVSDSHTPEHRAEAVALIRAGGPWDEEILGPRPTGFPMSWEPIS